jgi:hypothetical protein
MLAALSLARRLRHIAESETAPVILAPPMISTFDAVRAFFVHM